MTAPFAGAAVRAAMLWLHMIAALHHMLCVCPNQMPFQQCHLLPVPLPVHHLVFTKHQLLQWCSLCMHQVASSSMQPGVRVETPGSARTSSDDSGPVLDECLPLVYHAQSHYEQLVYTWQYEPEPVPQHGQEEE